MAVSRAGFNVLNLEEADLELDFFSDVPPRTFVAPLAQTAFPEGSLREPDLAGLATRLYGPARYVAVNKGRSAELGLVDALMKRGDVAVGHPLFMTWDYALERHGVRHEVAPAADHPGDLDEAWLRSRLQRGDVRWVIIEPGANARGGVPQRLQNVQAIRQLCDGSGAQLILDATRLLTSCLGLGARDYGLARELVALAGAFTVSAPKELLVPVGGLVGVRTLELLRRVFKSCRAAGTTLEPLEQRLAFARGLEQVLQSPELIAKRVEQVHRMAESLRAAGLKLWEPHGGHAVYVVFDDALLEGGPARARALEAHLYQVSGVRSVLWAYPHLPVKVMRLALAVGRYTDDVLATVGERFRAFFDRIDEAPTLVDAPHEEPSPVRGRYQRAPSER